MIKRNEGKLRFNDELFILYNEKLDQGLISEFKIINFQFNHFRNYVQIGLSKKKYKWVENFIEKYSKELPAEIRDEETGLSLAKLNLARGKFEESLACINSIKKIHYLIYTDAAILKLSILYEQGNYEEAFLEIDKLNHYLRNHNDIPGILNTYLINFIKFYQRILRLKTNPRKPDSKILKDEINSCGKVSKREWLLEKTKELYLH